MNPGEKPAAASNPPGVDETTAEPSLRAPLPPMEPLTPSAMAKLFGVPLVIIGVIVCGAVFVVFMFGAPAAPEQRSIGDLLAELESGGGEKSLGILLPREKVLWQAALELAVRLEKKQTEIPPEELEDVVLRLLTMIRTDLQFRENVPTIGADRQRQLEIRAGRLSFLIHALGKTEHDAATGVLLEVLETGEEPFIADAAKQLAELSAAGRLVEEKRESAVGAVIRTLTKSTRRETRLMAATVLSVLATKGDPGAVVALKDARLSGEGELAWACSLSLARLGSDAGKSTLSDMLDRGFWSTGDRYETVVSSGAVKRYAMPAWRTENLLIAAVGAAQHLSDDDLWSRIGRLQSDSSAAVRGAATDAVKARANGARKE